ncbi:MAG: ABC transporter ATP-binding protein [Xanthobacteraceae bacterium]|jgi:NitT/TauT family transport system ATP-binding protein
MDRLAIENLDVVYDTARGVVPAISKLTATVKEGEFVAVLGPSGCGKSTLLQVVAGLMQPSGGSVKLGGKEVTEPHQDVGVVFQTPTLLPWKTILENVMVPIDAMGLSRSTYLPRAKELIELVGLSEFESNYPRELSGGMQQRVGIARGLVHDPSMLLMDEPFAALDAMTREMMSIELQALWLAKRKSILFITHSISEAVFLADRVIVLTERPGRVREIVDVSIPRPRPMEAMGDRRFGEITTLLRSFFTASAKPGGARGE